MNSEPFAGPAAQGSFDGLAIALRIRSSSDSGFEVFAGVVVDTVVGMAFEAFGAARAAAETAPNRRFAAAGCAGAAAARGAGRSAALAAADGAWASGCGDVGAGSAAAGVAGAEAPA